MSAMTPIKIRGKRSAIPAERWGAGKKRKTGRDVATAPSDISSAAALSTSRAMAAPAPRKRKAVERQLSRIEELPTEILQDIFYFSANLNLALASPSLQTQLSSHHVYLQHTSRVLQPVLALEPKCEKRASLLGCTACCNHGIEPSNAELSAATRLLNSKFMTWEFFRLWLEERWEERDRSSIARMDTSLGIDDEYGRLWTGLQPSKSLVPPRKLLTGPWTADRVRFLSVLAYVDGREDLLVLDPVLGEVAYEGLIQAVAEKSREAVHALLRVAPELRPDTELVRKAVIDSGCDRLMVVDLMSTPIQESSVDLLDPALWSWAEKARASGDAKGKWLMDHLKERLRRKRIRESAQRTASIEVHS